MKRSWRCEVLVLALVAMSRPLPARAEATAAEKSQLAATVANLGSEQFAVRERAQTELSKMPLSQVELLRDTAKAAKDEEVRARLNARVAEMDVYILVHPRGLTVNVQNATFAEFTNELNKQLGSDTVQLAGKDGKITINAVNQPFWEIMRQLDGQFTVNGSSTGTSINAGVTKTVTTLTNIGGTKPRMLGVSDTFGLLYSTTGTRATGNWTLRCTVFTDPRIRVVDYERVPHINKLIDSGGNDLLPLVNSPAGGKFMASRPVGAFGTSITLSAAPAVKGIREMRGSVTMSVLESERTYTLDATKQGDSADTPRGKIMMDKDNNGVPVVKIIPPGDKDVRPAGSVPVVGESRVMVYLRVYAKSGALMGSTSSTGPEISLLLFIANRAANNQDPLVADPERVKQLDKVEVTMTEKTREYVLPIELKNFELPPP